jgi:two-component system sensor histidine kinase GlrK
MYVPLRRIPLKYLVLVGFLISLIPLGIFVWQSTAIQKNINFSWQQLTDRSIESVRIAVELESILVEIERSTKQSLILQTDSIAVLAADNINRYQDRINSFCAISPERLNEFCSEQKANIQGLKRSYATINETTLNKLLETLSKNQVLIMNHLWKSIDSAKDQQITIGEEKQKQVMVGLLLVSFLTFLLLILVSSQVATPVNMLKNKISLLGKEKQVTTNKPTLFNGPKELLEIDTQLDRLALRLTKLEMLRQSFLRHASHEFKTPLASIMESCAILKDQISGPLTPTQKEVVVILEDCTQNLKHLTEQLLDYNYLLQHSNPSLSSQNMQQLIEQSKSRYAQFFLKRKQTVNIECQLKYMETDPKLFTRVIDNLLSNAQAYGAENGHVLVQLYQDESNNVAILVVANTGPKVPVDQQSNILEPFGRSDVPRYDSLPGTGLGLSIVRDCVHLLNGTVAFVETPDFDFTIKIQFPLFVKGAL